VACTVDAARCAELIARYRNNRTSKEPDFVTQFNAVFHLLGRLKLSRHNVILAGKFINQMADTWTSRDQTEMVDQLRERQARSWKRWEKRIADKQAAKDAKKGWQFGRPPKQETPVPAPPAPENDVWNLVK
jgi:hypothetical protein